MAGNATKPSRRQRSVVSSFLCYGVEGTDNFRVSIFKRSDRVRSYKSAALPQNSQVIIARGSSPVRNKWAACSGSIETSDSEPLAAARREIEEETTLTSADITLLRAGKSYSIVDAELNTEWTIFPFAFLLVERGKGKDGIVIDWEHTTFDFVRPAEVDERDTVPHLSISLERVLVGKVVTEGLQELRNDHVNGASILAGKVVEVLTKAIREGDVHGIRSIKEREKENIGSMEAWWRGLRMIGWHLTMVRESMGAAITVAVCGALRAVQQEVDIGGNLEEVKRKALIRLEEVLLNRQHISGRIATQFESWLNEHFPEERPVTILTLSSSSTIKACLVSALCADTRRHIRLKVLESRPLFEGVAFVRSLLMEWKKRGVDDRLEVEIASDASVGVIGKDTDVVLLGADRISEDGDVSNKTGSLAAVLCAREVSSKAKVVVVSELEKVAAPGKMESHKEEDNEISELTAHWPSPKESEAQPTSELWKGAVKVRNVYFEWVPARHIDTYMSEHGDFSLESIKSWSRDVGRLKEEMFGDL